MLLFEMFILNNNSASQATAPSRGGPCAGCSGDCGSCGLGKIKTLEVKVDLDKMLSPEAKKLRVYDDLPKIEKKLDSSQAPGTPTGKEPGAPGTSVNNQGGPSSPGQNGNSVSGNSQQMNSMNPMNNVGSSTNSSHSNSTTNYASSNTASSVYEQRSFGFNGAPSAANHGSTFQAAVGASTSQSTWGSPAQQSAWGSPGQISPRAEPQREVTREPQRAPEQPQIAVAKTVSYEATRPQPAPVSTSTTPAPQQERGPLASLEKITAAFTKLAELARPEPAKAAEPQRAPESSPKQTAQQVTSSTERPVAQAQSTSAPQPATSTSNSSAQANQAAQLASAIVKTLTPWTNSDVQHVVRSMQSAISIASPTSSQASSAMAYIGSAVPAWKATVEQAFKTDPAVNQSKNNAPSVDQKVEQRTTTKPAQPGLTNTRENATTNSTPNTATTNATSQRVAETVPVAGRASQGTQTSQVGNTAQTNAKIAVNADVRMTRHNPKAAAMERSVNLKDKLSSRATTARDRQLDKKASNTTRDNRPARPNIDRKTLMARSMDALLQKVRILRDSLQSLMPFLLAKSTERKSMEDELGVRLSPMERRLLRRVVRKSGKNELTAADVEKEIRLEKRRAKQGAASQPATQEQQTATKGAAGAVVAQKPKTSGKVESASQGGPAKTLDIFQGKVGDDGKPEDGAGDYA